jgi:hypothetical protein
MNAITTEDLVRVVAAFLEDRKREKSQIEEPGGKQ